MQGMGFGWWMRAMLDIYKCQRATAANCPYKVWNGLSVIIFLTLGYNGNPLV